MSISACRSSSAPEFEPLKNQKNKVRFWLNAKMAKKNHELKYTANPLTLAEQREKDGQLTRLFYIAQQQLLADSIKCTQQTAADMMWHLVEKREGMTDSRPNRYSAEELLAIYLDIYKRPYTPDNNSRTLSQAIEDGLPDVDVYENQDQTFSLLYSLEHSRQSIFDYLCSRQKTVYNLLREVDIQIRQKLGPAACDPQNVTCKLDEFVKEMGYENVISKCEVRWFVEQIENIIASGLEKLKKSVLRKDPLATGEKLIEAMLCENSQTSTLTEGNLHSFWFEICKETTDSASLSKKLSIEEMTTQIKAQLPDVHFKLNAATKQVEMYSFLYPQISREHVVKFVKKMAVKQEESADSSFSRA